MLKWFEQVDRERPGIVSSRVRLVRNWDQYAFPSRLTPKEGMELIHRMEYGLRDLGLSLIHILCRSRVLRRMQRSHFQIRPPRWAAR